MTSESGSSLHTPLTPSPTTHPQNYVVLLPFYPTNHHRLHRRTLLLLLPVLLLLFSLSLFFLFPSKPHLQLARVSLNKIKINSHPSLSVDLSLDLTIRVSNRDFFSFEYDSLDVSIGYRNRELGFVESDGGNVKARTTSYVNATLVVDGVGVLHDLVYLIEDIAKGSVMFDTVTKVKGKVGVLFIDVPIQAKVSCEIYVNPKTQKINHQNCYPE